MEYPVIILRTESKSFSWANGLYALIERNENVQKLCKIDDKTGCLQRFENNELLITEISSKNPNTCLTQMVIKL